MKVVIAGGSGFLGQAVARCLVARGDDVVVLARGDPPPGTSGRAVSWDGRTLGSWAGELDGADALVNVTGASIGTRPTRRNVDRLIRSRVEPITALRDAIAAASTPPRVWVQTAAVGIFGDTGDEVLDESSIPSGIGPRALVGVCLAWEHAFAEAAESADRHVLLRLGAVVGGGDKLTSTLARLTRLGLGGRAGSGHQWVSWIALADVVATIVAAIDDEQRSGLYHVAAPEAVTNREMMATFRRLLRMPVGIPAPSLAVRVGAWVQGNNPSLVLAGQRALPRRLLDAGFEFAQPAFAPALRQALLDGGRRVR